MTSTVKNCLNFEPVSCVTSIHSASKRSPKSRAMRPKVVHGCLVHGIKRLLFTNPILFASALEQFCETTSSTIQWYQVQAVSENTHRGSVRQPIVATAHSQRRLWFASRRMAARPLRAPLVSLDWHPSQHRVSHIRRRPPSHAPGQCTRIARRPQPTPTHVNDYPPRR